MINAILLDLDGPLLDGKLRHHTCYADILTAHGYNFLDIDTYWKMKRKRISRREQLAATGAESLYDEFLDEWLRNIEKPEYLMLDRVQDGVPKILNTWVAMGLKIMLVTMRNNHSTLMQQLQSNGLFAHFSDVLVCKHADGGAGKAIQVLHHYPDIKPTTCLWVGDTEADAEAARYLGCPVWLLTSGLRTKSFLQTLQPEFISEHLDNIDIEEIFNAR